MNEFLPVVRDILQQFLSVAPLKGARLKPLVMREFERRTKTPFAGAFFMYPKFSDLLRQMDDLVEVDTSGPGAKMPWYPSRFGITSSHRA